jgi:hypothetical protein
MKSMECGFSFHQNPSAFIIIRVSWALNSWIYNTFFLFYIFVFFLVWFFPSILSFFAVGSDFLIKNQLKMHLDPFFTKLSNVSDPCVFLFLLSAEYGRVITLQPLTCQDTVMTSLPHAGVFSRKSVSLITLHGSNDTSFLADKADSIKYMVLLRAIADGVVRACVFYLLLN